MTIDKDAVLRVKHKWETALAEARDCHYSARDYDSEGQIEEFIDDLEALAHASEPA